MIAAQKPCIGIIGWAFGHNHEPRYSVVKRSHEWVAKLGGSIFRSDIPADEEKRMYHGDVCARCGDVVNVPPPSVRGAAAQSANSK